MQLNRKGYLTIEIVLASAVAFAIAFFLMELTVKLVSKTDDTYHDTILTYDNAIMINNFKEKIEVDIISQNGIYSINCTNNECKIIYNLTENQGDERYLYYDSNSKEIIYAYGADDRNILYSKKVDSSISEVEISSSTTGKLTSSDKIVFFNIKLKNIFTDNTYEMIIPINLVTTTDISANNITIKFLILITGNGNIIEATKTFNKTTTDLYEFNLYEEYDQAFKSETSETIMKCYTGNNDSAEEYDFTTLDTIRYQGYYVMITNKVPNNLYCYFSELYDE